MKNYLLLFLTTALFFSCTQNKNPQPPVAKKIPHYDTTHGDIRVDNYRWMHDKTNQKVIDYLNEENKYTDEIMEHTKPLQEKLYNEMLGRIKETDMNVPYKLDSFYYYSRTEKGKDYSISCRKKGSMDAAEEIIYDENEEAKKYQYFELGAFEISNNHNLVACCIDTMGNINYTCNFKNLETGKYLPDVIGNSSSIVWANDNKTVFYSFKDSTNRDYRIYRHDLGTDVKNDVLVYEEQSEEFEISVYKTKSKEYIIINCYNTLSTEIRYLNANNPTGKFQVINTREKNHEYEVDHYEDKFYITTNWQAKNFRLMITPVDKTSKENWKELIPHRETVRLLGIEIFKNYLVVQERSEGLLKIRVINWNDKNEYYLPFPETVYSTWIGFNPDFNTDLLRYSYTSFITPRSVYEYDMSSQKQNLLKRQEVMGNFNSSDYESERIYARAQDGVMVPISLVYKKGLEKNGTHPCLLKSYGSYGGSTNVYFNSNTLALLDRGFVYALAHVRGGEEMGRQWYEDGKLLKKKNTFTDFISCAEKLMEGKFTSSEKLVISGGSAGGLLMGAVLNMRPDLFKAVIAEVPFVDVINTMLNPGIPLTTLEYDEWGNPNDKVYYDYMKSYSPYDNVAAQNYPQILVRTSLNDSQVAYFEPAKWVAKLRSMKTDDNPILMKIDMASGHGGPSGRYTWIKEIAFQYAYMMDAMGITE